LRGFARNRTDDRKGGYWFEGRSGLTYTDTREDQVVVHQRARRFRLSSIARAHDHTARPPARVVEFNRVSDGQRGRQIAINRQDRINRSPGRP
jgi:hypothetical protein